MEVPSSVCHIFPLFNTDDNTLHGPVFLQEPNSVIFPLDSEEKKVKLSCEVKGNPRPTIGFVECLTVLLHNLNTTTVSPKSSSAGITQHNSVMPLESTTMLIMFKKKLKGHQEISSYCNTIAIFGQEIKKVAKRL